MAAAEAIVLAAGDVRVAVWPALGGRIGQMTFGDTELLVGRTATDDPMRWGCYPMVPWAGRIRGGRFTFDGRPYELARPDGAPHAIHGVGFVASWEVVESTDDDIRLGLDLPADGSWPFGGRVEQRIAVDRAGATVEMTLDADRQSFPASMGWHPWFRKPDRLEFRPTAMYRRDDDHVAVDELVAVPPGPWDDCFVNHEPVGLSIEGVEVTLTSPCTHWVVYDEPDHATCVEPQTGPPDAFTIAPVRVDREHALATSFRIDVRGPVTTARLQ